MDTLSALLAICTGNSPVPGEFPAQRPVTRSFDVFFDRYPNKRLSKQSWGWWFEMPSRSLWRRRNDIEMLRVLEILITSRNTVYPTLSITWLLLFWSSLYFGIIARISNYINAKRYEVIIHPCPNFNGSLINSLLELVHECVISSFIDLHLWELWEEITNTIPNLNGVNFEFSKWINNNISHS